MTQYYIRRINPLRWNGSLPEEDDYLSLGTDGITNCCKTTDNELSIWLTDSKDPESENNKKVLAVMAAGSEKPSTIDFIFISEEEFTERDLTLKKTDGKTAVSSMRYLHRDIESLDVKKLAILGMLIHKKANDDNEIHRVSASKIKQYVRHVFKDGTPQAEEIKSIDGWSKVYN
jgi:hypothetical protein